MSAPVVHFESPQATLWHGDCIETMRLLPDASVDAVVTDPPYGIAFMGKAWDQPGEFGSSRKNGTPAVHGRERSRDAESIGDTGAMEAGRYDLSPSAMVNFGRWCEAWAIECLRVLKPGGHILAFGGSRTWHRLAAGIEDAGFEIRDSIAWLYGSGFPKSLDVSKAIDKAAGADREKGAVIGRTGGGRTAMNDAPGNGRAQDYLAGEYHESTPATAEAEKWQGWGTALKPAFEPIVVGRKPLIGTVAANVLAHGTGALNIDASRIATSDKLGGGAEKITAAGQRHEGWVRPWMDDPQQQEAHAARVRANVEKAQDLGRWPTNVLIDSSQAESLDAQTGTLTSGTGAVKRESASDASGNRSAALGAESRPAGTPMLSYGHSGGASRFFPTFRYEAKAKTAERPVVDGVAHPTVKPIAIMRWLVTLVTPPGGTVLEPFAGSGTTLEAAVREGFTVIGIEREADYLPLIVHRLMERDHQQSLFGEWES